jgi:hypothetical protein
MERPERYDPEDIEHLLSERSFDALLQEERAYVLRHLGGREEYENMRALLLHVRSDEQDREGIAAEEATRERVLAAFRAQQQPQWRIWLNSVAAAFALDRHQGFLRPALAFGSLAVLIGLGAYLTITFTARPDAELAEVRPAIRQEEKAAPAPPAAVNEPAGPVSDPVEELRTVTVQAEAEAATDAVPPPSTSEMESDAPVGESKAYDVPDVQHEEPAVAEKAENFFLNSSPTAVDLQDVRVVDVNELHRNQSTSNVSGAVTSSTAAKRSKDTKREAARSRSMAEDPELRALLAQGW